MGPSRALRVFSKKLFGRGGVVFRQKWGATVVGVDTRLRGYDERCGGLVFGGVWGAFGAA